jgi:hydrophobic/amphiphilic exporter-1 (mainly G- bacteria), HAE1 family
MKNRNIFLLLIFCLLIFHYLKDMRFSYYPEAMKKVLSLRIEMEGAGPQQIEELLCNPLEEEILQMQGITNFYSRSGREETEITLFLDDQSDLNRCYLDLRNLVERKSVFFPPSAAKAVIRKSSKQNSPVFILVPELTDEEMIENSSSSWTEERIRSELKGINGISEIHISSSAEKDINIEFDEDKLNSLQMDASALAGIIHQHNCISTVCLEDSKVIILDQRLKSLGDFESLPLNPALTLSETAEVNMGRTAVKSFSRLNGKRQSIVWIYESGDTNTIDLCRSLRAASEKLPNSLILYDKGKIIEEALGELILILCLSITAVVLITFLILKKVRSAVPVYLNILFSIGGTLAAFNMASWEINILVLSTLALCSGMIIDSGIIVLEQGYEKSKKALWSSLLSTLIVLTPFLFASNRLKTLCNPLIRALCICLTLSVVFILLTMKHYKGQSIQKGFSSTPYQKSILIKVFSEYRKLAGIILLLIIILSVFQIKNITISQDFKLKNDSISFSVEFPAGSSKEWIEKELNVMEHTLSEIETIEYYSSEYKDEKASYMIKLSEHASREKLEQSIKQTKEVLPGFLYFEDRPAEDSYNIRILTHDRSLLYEESEILAHLLHSEMSEQNLIMHYKKQQPLLKIKTDNSLSLVTGITPIVAVSSLGQQLSPPVLGKWIPGIPGDSSIYDIRIFNHENDTIDISEIGNLKIRGNGEYSLDSLSVLSDQEDYGPIEHSNSQRSSTFSFSSRGMNGTEIHKSINRILLNYKLPVGVRVIHGEEYQNRRDSIKELIKMLLTSILLLFMLLVFVFESAFLPICLMGQIIICYTFTLASLSLMNVNLSVPVFFALILNTGLCINNGLIVFSRFKKKRPTMEEALAAMIECRTTVLSAALTTLTGFLPFLTAGESSAELLKALSLTIGSAVLFSILLLIGSLFCFMPKEIINGDHDEPLTVEKKVGLSLPRENQEAMLDEVRRLNS